MKIRFTPAEEAFRAECAAWLQERLDGPFSDIRGIMSQTHLASRRQEWERELGRARFSVIGWPQRYGGRDATLAEQVIFAEEYARSGAPGRVGHLGTELAGPTILHFGDDLQRERFLLPIAKGEEFWCQGYSEPNAGSDLSNVRTRARLEHGPQGAEWVIEGQKIWTSLAQFADWSFVVCRTEEGTSGPAGISYLLVPMRQKGVTVKPIRQMTGDAEFNEVFFDGARTKAEHCVGKPGEGWKVAMGTLAFERGVSTLAQQMTFRNELERVVAEARRNGAARDPLIRQRLAEAYTGLRIMRYSALRMLSRATTGSLGPEALTYKLHWATWRKKLGELAMDVVGAPGELCRDAGYGLDDLPYLYLMSRSDTIYGGTNQIQRNIIAERALGLPKEARGDR